MVGAHGHCRSPPAAGTPRRRVEIERRPPVEPYVCLADPQQAFVARGGGVGGRHSGGRDHVREMQAVPAHDTLEGPVEPVEIGGEDVVAERRTVRPALGQPLPPQRGLGTGARKQHRDRRGGRPPRADQVVAPVRRGAHDPLGLDNAQYTPRACGAVLCQPQPEGLAGLGQHRRQHREALLGQHQIAEPVDGGKRRRQPLQHDADLPAPAREAGPRPEPERRQAHRRMAFLLGERHRRSGRRRRTRKAPPDRAAGSAARTGPAIRRRRKTTAPVRITSPPRLSSLIRISSGAAQSRRTIRRSASTVSTAACPAWIPASRRAAISGASVVLTTTIAGRAGTVPAAKKLYPARRARSSARVSTGPVQSSVTVAKSAAGTMRGNGVSASGLLRRARPGQLHERPLGAQGGLSQKRLRRIRRDRPARVRHGRGERGASREHGHQGWDDCQSRQDSHGPAAPASSITRWRFAL